jgi:hypothetical protein
MRGCAVVHEYMAACHEYMHNTIYKLKGGTAHLFVGIQKCNSIQQGSACTSAWHLLSYKAYLFHKNPRNCSITDIDELQQHKATINPHLTHRLNDHPLSAATNCSFRLFTAIFHYEC